MKYPKKVTKNTKAAAKRNNGMSIANFSSKKNFLKGSLALRVG